MSTVMRSRASNVLVTMKFMRICQKATNKPLSSPNRLRIAITRARARKRTPPRTFQYRSSPHPLHTLFLITEHANEENEVNEMV